jgi:hypothetical protein
MIRIYTLARFKLVIQNFPRYGGRADLAAKTVGKEGGARPRWFPTRAFIRILLNSTVNVHSNVKCTAQVLRSYVQIRHTVCRCQNTVQRCGLAATVLSVYSSPR